MSSTERFVWRVITLTLALTWVMASLLERPVTNHRSWPSSPAEMAPAPAQRPPGLRPQRERTPSTDSDQRPRRHHSASSLASVAGRNWSELGRAMESMERDEWTIFLDL